MCSSISRTIGVNRATRADDFESDLIDRKSDSCQRTNRAPAERIGRETPWSIRRPDTLDCICKDCKPRSARQRGHVSTMISYAYTSITLGCFLTTRVTGIRLADDPTCWPCKKASVTPFLPCSARTRVALNSDAVAVMAFIPSVFVVVAEQIYRRSHNMLLGYTACRSDTGLIFVRYAYVWHSTSIPRREDLCPDDDRTIHMGAATCRRSA